MICPKCKYEYTENIGMLGGLVMVVGCCFSFILLFGVPIWCIPYVLWLFPIFFISGLIIVFLESVAEKNSFESQSEDHIELLKKAEEN